MERTKSYAWVIWGFPALTFLAGCEATTMPPLRQPLFVEPSSAREPSRTTQWPSLPEISGVPTPATHAPFQPAPPTETPPPPPAPAIAVPAAAPSPPASPSGEVIHLAELRGKIGKHDGNRLTIEPLVATSSTLPAAGSKAELWVESKQEDGEDDWQLFAEVEVTTTAHFGEDMNVKILAEDGDLGAEGLRLSTLALGSRVRLQWEW